MEIIAIVLLNIVLYYNTIKFSAIVDDIKRYENYRIFDWSMPLRSMREALYGGATFGKNLAVDHAFTLALHTTACVLIYLAFGSNNISFWAAILYSCNPVNNQTSIWLNGRRYLINIIIVLLMIILGKYGGILYPLTGAFQVTAVFAPILLFKYSPIYPLLSAVFILVLWRTIKKKVDNRLKDIKDVESTRFSLKNLIVIIKYYGEYLFRMPFPGICKMIYPTLYYWRQTEAGNKNAYSINIDFYKGTLAVVASVFLVLVSPDDIKPYAVFMILSTLQWSAIIPVTQDLADRYVSLPNVFMMFFVSYFAHQYLGLYTIPTLVGIASMYFVYTKIVMRMYRDIPHYWEYHRFYSPSIPSPRKYEINWLMKRGDFTKAWVLTREGLQYNENEFALLSQAAVCHQAIGEHEIARSFCYKAMKNYHIGQKESQEPQLLKILSELRPIEQPVVSRQVRRAEDRKGGDRDGKKSKR